MLQQEHVGQASRHQHGASHHVTPAAAHRLVVGAADVTPAPRRTRSTSPLPRQPQFDDSVEQAPDSSPLIGMLLDVDEGPSGSVHLWATTHTGASALIRVLDFEPSWWIASPTPTEPWVPSVGGNESGSPPPLWTPPQLDSLRTKINMKCVRWSRHNFCMQPVAQPHTCCLTVTHAPAGCRTSVE
jgi:hypothetical protein